MCGYDWHQKVTVKSLGALNVLWTFEILDENIEALQLRSICLCLVPRLRKYGAVPLWFWVLA